MNVSSTKKVLRTGVNHFVKNSVSRIYQGRARDAWNMSEGQFWEYQKLAFRSMLDFASGRVPYYRQHPELYSEVADHGHILDIIRAFPILPKHTVKERNQEFWPDPLQRFTTFHTTSGTSGTPLRIPATLLERSFSRAIVSSWHHRITGSWTPRALVLSGFLSPGMDSSELYWKDRLGKRVFLSIYSLKQANKDTIRELVDRFQPELVSGYPSAVNQLAELFADEGLAGKERRNAIVTAEVLQPHWRQSIENSLVRRVFSLYGSQEGAHAVFQCERGCLHINPLIGIVEVLDANGEPAAKGETGRVVVTSLLRKSFPLIRYDIGDLAESTGYASGCTCGIEWPTIGHVQGRAEDLIEMRDGRRIGMLSYTTFRDLRGVKEAQLVQRGYEEFLVRIVPSEQEGLNKTEVEAMIRHKLHERLSTPVSISFSYERHIDRGPNGKFKAVLVDF